jgi:hypothetical protein
MGGALPTIMHTKKTDAISLIGATRYLYGSVNPT